jgi:membrane protein
MGKIVRYILDFIRFATIDVWRISSHEEKGRRGILYLVLKTMVLTIRDFLEGKMQMKASALTYYSVFALIPLLAFVFGIARGFGFDSYIIEFIIYKYPEQEDGIKYIFELVESYLAHARRGGVFVGIGIVFLFWSVLNVFTQIEDSFNEIWRVKKNRTFVRKFTDFFSLLFLIPFLITISSGISFYFNFIISYLNNSYIISPALNVLLALLPYITSWLIFTLIYIVVPNTKVRFSKAAIAGLVAGVAFQLFQMLYIWAQQWMTGYNAIYGSLAALPLLLLFVQITWTIVLFGAELSYAGQSVRSFEYESDVKNISHRYYEFVMLALAKIIFKRFENGEEPLSLEKLAAIYKIPVRLVSVMIDRLCQAGIIVETCYNEEKETGYQPALDINKITVAYFFNRIDTSGSESFKLENREEFKSVWDYTCQVRETISRASKNRLVKDI